MSTLVGDQLATLVEDVASEITFDYWGVGGATEHYYTQFDSSVYLIQAKKFHPKFSWLKRKTASVTREEAGLCKVTINYEGIPPETNDKVYKVTNATSTEPIESHPDFVTKIGGKKGAKLHNAKFSDEGEFERFPILEENGTTKNKKAGVKSYLLAGIVYEETWTVGSTGFWDSSIMTPVGQINTPPTSPLFVTGRNWLLKSCDISEKGFGYLIVRKWRRSGPNLWDEDIYKNSSDSPAQT